MTQAVAVRDETTDKRSAALLKAIGLDRVPVEQRELAIAIADRYELDLMLKHLVLVDGRPYITRDGLLHIAHRSGQFDGMEVTDPSIVEVPGKGTFWTSKCSVYRKDMGRPFTYPGRYPTKGGNERFAPEMAVKVGEVMALRRAFDVSAPVLEERWDMDAAAVAPDPEPPRTTAQVIADRKAAVTTSAPSAQGTGTDGAVASPEAAPEVSGDDGVIEGVAVATGLSADELRAWLREWFIGITEAREAAKGLFGNDSLTAITDQQRATLRDELAKAERS